MTMKLVVRLNGTEVNPWHRFGLRQNPFPQIAEYKLMPFMEQLNSLDADPLLGPEDIKGRLQGWSDEFVDLCISQFKPGSLVEFEVTFPAEEG